MALQDLTPQLRTRLGRVERLVGLFLILTVALMLSGLAYFVHHTAKERGWFVEKFPYYTYVKEVTGIKVGTPVTMMGFTVGEVTLVDQAPPDPYFVNEELFVYIGFKVRSPYEGYIWTDSRVKVGGGDFLGSRTLEITRGSVGEVTVKHVPDGEPLMLSDAMVYDPKLTNRNYLPLAEAGKGKGFWLKASESQALQQRLSEIAGTVNQALPQVFGLTNQIAATLSNLTSVTAQLKDSMPKLQAAVDSMNGLVADVRPALQKPGGIGELLLPTNLNQQLALTLSNLDPGSGPIALTLSNLNGRMADVGVALSNVNLQLGQNTNLLADANQLTRNVGSLADTIQTLLTRHWLFRSAFKTNPPPRRPVNPPRDLRRF
ncbi:MAG: MCE family protein [Verrucomicrobia bacterium]|nr:MCE family protein [Verrucomicrobiota bacterium]